MAAEVKILVGTDCGGIFPVVPGFSYPDELELLVEAGMSSAEVLEAATVNAAKALGVAHQRGRIAPGQDADLVLLGSNPLDDIKGVRSVRAVMVGDLWLDRSSLDHALTVLRRR